MKRKKKLLLGSMAAAAVTGAAVYVLTQHNSHNRLKHVSNEGYETAHDILYPQKKNKKKKLKFGPVLPFTD